MDTTEASHLLNLGRRGVVEGTTFLQSDTKRPICHYFRGIPYGLSPAGEFRWRRPRALPDDHVYGTFSSPGRFVKGAGVCPQPAYLSPPQPDTWNEDCLQVNIWLPIGEAPREGWPVYFYIHGGSLQLGSPNDLDYKAVLAQTACQSIIVCPAYRLNVFGFLASEELANETSSKSVPASFGNYGFWDQRLALEWTQQNIDAFGGDASNITVGGHSAGSHSIFHQLAYDLYAPKPVGIRRVVMFSNGPGVQPKTKAQAQEQAEQLYAALEFPSNLPPHKKLQRLRSVPAEVLVDVNTKLSLHQWRATTDGGFVRPQLFADIESGDFVRRMLDRDVHVLIGEVSEERFFYSTWHPPTNNSLDSLRARLSVEYPAEAVHGALRVWFPDNRLPAGMDDWDADAFGRVYSDMQVYATGRGFISALERAGAGRLVHRYRIEWRAKSVDQVIPSHFGVTHITDMIGVWWFGGQLGLETNERVVVQGWVDGLGDFIRGERLGAGWGGPRKYRLLGGDGTTSVVDDEDYDRGCRVWAAARTAQVLAAKRHEHL